MSWREEYVSDGDFRHGKLKDMTFVGDFQAPWNPNTLMFKVLRNAATKHMLRPKILVIPKARHKAGPEYE